MKLRGIIEHVIFQNTENGYTVVSLDVQNLLYTVVGTFPPVAEGDEIEASGELKTNSKYGEQFIADEVKTVLPESEDGIRRYLASGLFKGIGEKTAKTIVDTFGAATLKVIEQTPERLSEIKGISRVKAMDIADAFSRIKGMQDSMLFLKKYDISTNLALKIFKHYGTDTQSIIEENPYCLVNDIDGVGFLTADIIARSMGIPCDSVFRIRAGIEYILTSVAAQYGNTYLKRTDCIESVKKLLNIDSDEPIINALDDLLFSDVVKQFSFDDGVELIAETKAYNTEKSIAQKLIRLNNEFDALHIDADAEIEEYERTNGIKLHNTQADAVKSAVNSGVVVITGGPGTGKTTIIKCIVGIFEARHIKVSLCAPTGRAAKRLSESVGREAKTIHRLLDLNYKNGKGYFTYDENTKLDSDVIIVDEVSMADIYTFNSLIKAIVRGGRLIMVGDKDQLPSVSAGNVLKDVIGSGIIPVNYLNKIYRQGEESLIVTNAHLINDGKMPILDKTDGDCFFISRQTPEDILAAVKEMVVKRLPSYVHAEPKEIQVLSAVKKGVCGVNNINKELQQILNPQQEQNILQYGEAEFRLNDKVMQTVNNYQREWQRADDLGNVEYGTGVYNGDMGYIESVDIKNKTLRVLLDDGRYAVYNGEDIRDLILAYAISVHKSQGCEFNSAVIVVQGGSPQIMTRNLLYTALTRVKKAAVLIGREQNVRYMVNNNYTAERLTTLNKLLVAEEKTYNEFFS